ncbi:ABC transporter permease [Salinisphaera sp. LB1]|uniref:ABC transporter permease n=1 Tax=Salinisphaera sp. LB1 TaxID=2183911 RepID=UPI000D707037|nr:ABC transporter permease [Salinisphaera sp. LB1]AWN14369.1 Ribose ABC transport system, permease protein RbsC [Salinisphaera sp. LB1]
MIVERYYSSLTAIIGLVLLAILFAYIQPMILSPFGVNMSVNQGTTLALAALAQLLVVLTGGVDLSVGAMVGLTNAIAATYMGTNPAIATAVLIGTLFAGTLAGFVNGVIVAYGRIQPIIVTLATLYIYTGVGLLVRPQPGGTVPGGFANALTGSWGYLPYALIFLLGVVGLAWVPLMRSRLGRAIKAIGDNRNGARVSGISVARTELWAYTAGGFFAACAGIFLTAQTTSGDPTIGTSYTLNSVAAVVFGGAVLGGGRGVALGPICGAYFLSLLISVLFASGVSPFYQNLLQGAILVIVLATANVWRLRTRHWLNVMSN